MRISDWSSDVFSSDLAEAFDVAGRRPAPTPLGPGNRSGDDNLCVVGVCSLTEIFQSSSPDTRGNHLPQLDLSFVSSQFPAFAEPSLTDWAFFENAGGSSACAPVIERLTRSYRETQLTDRKCTRLNHSP